MNNFLKYKVLVTGAAGFIGSNLIETLINKGYENIIALDNFETGGIENINEFIESNKIHFIKADITNYNDCLNATKNCSLIFHQAALGSVKRSIENPTKTHEVNVTGFTNILEAARVNNVKRVVYASSSSVYGDDQALPKTENKIGNQLSPYAVTKRTNELYANVFYNLYGIETIGLRYFNVFGPKQNPNGAYAAVIPIFINNLLQNKPSAIFGTGENKRDFTFVENVVQANILAATTINKNAFGNVFNVAFGGTFSVNELYNTIKQKLNSSINPEYKEPRQGEITNSFADVTKAKEIFNYIPIIGLNEGLDKTIDYYKKNF